MLLTWLLLLFQEDKTLYIIHRKKCVIHKLKKINQDLTGGEKKKRVLQVSLCHSEEAEKKELEAEDCIKSMYL